MRNGQNNNKRMRNRNNNNNNNNNRRGQNPMTRVFESNGPDIKIRGTASHVAEKYVQLARDARSSGDPVAAENYYQHAEHYFRLIAAAQEQFRQNQPQPRTENEMASEDGDDDSESFSNFGQEPGFAPVQPQPMPMLGIESRTGEGRSRKAPLVVQLNLNITEELADIITDDDTVPAARNAIYETPSTCPTISPRPSPKPNK